MTRGIMFEWSSRQAFLEQGAGFCLFRGEEMVSHCISVLAGAGELVIGIGTEQPYRRRGFALLTASPQSGAAFR